MLVAQCCLKNTCTKQIATTTKIDIMLEHAENLYIYTYIYTLVILLNHVHFFCNSSQLWVCCTEAHKYGAKGWICWSSVGKINAHQTCTPTERNTVEPLFKLPLTEHLVNCTVNQGPAKSVISKMHISKLFSCRIIIITVIIMGNSFKKEKKKQQHAILWHELNSLWCTKPDKKHIYIHFNKQNCNCKILS